MKIQTKIIIAVLLWTIAANIIFSFFFIQNIRNSEMESLNTKIKKTEILLQQVNVNPLFNFNEKNIKTNLKSFLDDPELVGISIKDNDGIIDITMEDPEIQYHDKLHRTIGIFYQNVKIGEMSLIFSTHIIDQKIRQQSTHLLIFITLFIFGISISLYALLKTLSGPIIELAEIMNYATRKNDFSIRINKKGGAEMSALYSGFNSMFHHIQKYRNKLEKHKAHLEEIVHARTIELLAINGKLEKEKEKAESANKAKSVFLANMSHELRTPLNAVLGYSEVLAAREKDSRNKQYLESIQLSGKALLSLINNVLDLAKIESGKMSIEKNPVSIHQLFNEVATIFKGKTAEKDIDFTINTSAEIPKALLLDDIKLRQILINLTGNAVKFTPSGSVSVSCSAKTKIKNSLSYVDLTIEVKDTGIGIPKNQCETIFNAFEHVPGKKTSHFEGTGLGLTITKNMVELMGGIIEFESLQGKGSLFRILLPDVELARISAPDNNNKEIINPENIVFKPSSVLIAEDIDYNSDMLKTFLSQYDLSLFFAENGRKAVAIAQSEKPDIILMDYKMPEMDGIQAAVKIKSHPATKDIPVIMLSASVLKENQNKLQSVAEGFIAKPISQATLIQELMKYLDYTINYPEKKSTPAATNEFKLPDKKQIDQLYELSMDGDLEGVREILTDIVKDKTLVAFCFKALKFVNNYDSSGLLAFIRHYKNKG